MNRLIIIGNGFDLAHGLPTGYCDFINDYWKQIDNYRKDKFLEFNPCQIPSNFISFSDFLNKYRSFAKDKGWQLTNDDSDWGILTRDRSYTEVLSFKNEFFRIICQKNIQNWVDIENEYYILLKNCLNKGKSIIELNKQFEDVKSLLEKYLIKNVEDKFDFSNLQNNDISRIFSETVYDKSNLPSLFAQFSGTTVKYFQNFFKETKANIINTALRMRYEEKIEIRNYFISFNYTSTAYNYSKQHESKPELNEIHGRLLDERNPINFGFGDEMDRQYQEIEERNDNEYLRNIKSFQYLHTSNYKRLLDLIDSEKFQVYIMGHSCGLSDRTLLNTVFEHENCISIKIFYHEILDDEGNYVKDNYTEITQNISRHFNKKKLMREKIVNKPLCYPLPQIKLPKKQNGPQP